VQKLLHLSKDRKPEQAPGVVVYFDSRRQKQAEAKKPARPLSPTSPITHELGFFVAVYDARPDQSALGSTAECWAELEQAPPLMRIGRPQI
jgi:hypothetical protein